MRDAWNAARARPALSLYLAALAALGFKWLSPISSAEEHAGWSDVLVAGAAAAWLWELARARRLPALRGFHLALGLYLLAGVVSMTFADARGTGAVNVLLITELAVLALLTSEFASEPAGRDAIVVVIAAVALFTAALAVVGLALFYAGVHTSLIASYGEQLIASGRYARVGAGFESAPLLGSFCIFASAVVSREDSPLPRRLRLLTQAALALLVLSTVSRGIIGFVAAAAIRAGHARRGSPWPRRVAVATVIASVAVMAALTVGRLRLDPSRPSTVSYVVPDPHDRREAFATGVDTLADHPLVGKGPGSLVSENRGTPFRAHLTPLNVAATMGIPALLALSFLGLVLWRERRRPIEISTWSGLAGLAIDGLGQDIEHFRHLWVMVGLADADRADM